MENKNLLNEKKENLTKNINEHNLAKEDAKATRAKGLLCTITASGLLASILGPTLPIVATIMVTLGILAVGSIGTIIYSNAKVPNKRKIKNLAREIADLENEKIENKEEVYSLAPTQEKTILEPTTQNVVKYSKANIDEFNK